MDKGEMKKILAGVGVATLIGATAVSMGCANKHGSCTGKKNMSEVSGKSGCSGEKDSMKQSGCSGEKSSTKQSGCSGEKDSTKQSGCSGEKNSTKQSSCTGEKK
jgi:hypothetical protein